MLRYDQKQSDSKMVSSITTLGYLVMTLLSLALGWVARFDSKKSHELEGVQWQTLTKLKHFGMKTLFGRESQTKILDLLSFMKSIARFI